MERDFQKSTCQNLENGDSTLVVAPTGLGKTQAALNPFAQSRSGSRNCLLGTRLIYTLPLRALARGIRDECQNLGIQPVVHHGDEPESQFFSERAIITTIDQYLTAFAGAPLSWASHLSHAAAGAVLTSYSVFDEVHLLSPQKGLPLLFAMLYLRKRWGLLSCVMTATLPPSVIRFFQDFCGLKVVEASTRDVGQRDNWRKVLVECLMNGASQWQEKDETGLTEFVQEKWESWNTLGVHGPQKMIIFVNTVDRALKISKVLSELNLGRSPKILLAHSRFTRDDRQYVEGTLQEFFGRGSRPDPAILVTTQVAEAGLNISAPVVITELCPMDSLIQRAGRCQRFKPDSGEEMVGKVFVVKPPGEEWFSPYSDAVKLVEVKKVIENGREKYSKPSKTIRAIEFTRTVLEQKVGTNPVILDWGKEKELIEKSLDRLYRAYLAGTNNVDFDRPGEEPYQSLYRQYKPKRKKNAEAVESESGDGHEEA